MLSEMTDVTVGLLLRVHEVWRCIESKIVTGFTRYSSYRQIYVLWAVNTCLIKNFLRYVSAKNWQNRITSDKVYTTMKKCDSFSERQCTSRILRVFILNIAFGRHAWAYVCIVILYCRYFYAIFLTSPLHCVA